jgi:hypothetical protein
MKKPLVVAAAAIVTLLSIQPVPAQTARTAPENPATHHHGLPGNNPGFGENNGSANPNGGGKNGGDGIHGIDNVPGKNADNHPSNGHPGFRDQLNTVHGGLGGGH